MVIYRFHLAGIVYNMAYAFNNTVASGKKKTALLIMGNDCIVVHEDLYICSQMVE